MELFCLADLFQVIDHCFIWDFAVIEHLAAGNDGIWDFVDFRRSKDKTYVVFGFFDSF